MGRIIINIGENLSSFFFNTSTVLNVADSDGIHAIWWKSETNSNHIYMDPTPIEFKSANVTRLSQKIINDKKRLTNNLSYEFRFDNPNECKDDMTWHDRRNENCKNNAYYTKKKYHTLIIIIMLMITIDLLLEFQIKNIHVTAAFRCSEYMNSHPLNTWIFHLYSLFFFVTADLS